jgi:hypothetical protein
LDAIDNNGGIARSKSTSSFSLQEALRVLDYHFDAFSQDVDVCFDQGVLLEQVFDAHQMFTVIFRQ